MIVDDSFPLNHIMHLFITSQTREALQLFKATILNAKYYDGSAVEKLLELKQNSCARTLMEVTYRLPGGSNAEKRKLIMHFSTHETDNY